MRFCSVLLACLLPAMMIAVEQPEPPSIEFEFLSRDSGKVVQGRRIREKFSFTNKGKGVLEIIDVEKS